VSNQARESVNQPVGETVKPPATAIPNPVSSDPQVLADALRSAETKGGETDDDETSDDRWLEHSMQVDIEAPIDRVWAEWANLENMSQWMRWIHGVEILPEDPGLSRWTLKSGLWEFSWLARTLKVVPNQIIQWKAVDGLPNRGAIRFYDRKDSTVVKMTIAYAIPGPIGQLMDNLFLGRIVESTIQGDLNRFRQFVLDAIAAETP